MEWRGERELVRVRVDPVSVRGRVDESERVRVYGSSERVEEGEEGRRGEHFESRRRVERREIDCGT